MKYSLVFLREVLTCQCAANSILFSVHTGKQTFHSCFHLSRALIRHERLVVLRLECVRRLIYARWPSGEACARRRIVRTQAVGWCERYMEKQAATRCQTWNCGERAAMFPIHYINGGWMPSFPLSRHCMFDYDASDDLLSLVSPGASLCADTIVLFILSEKSKEYPIMTEHQLSLLPFYAGSQYGTAPLTGEKSGGSRKNKRPLSYCRVCKHSQNQWTPRNNFARI
jgi:hypothetical protein